MYSVFSAVTKVCASVFFVCLSDSASAAAPTESPAAPKPLANARVEAVAADRSSLAVSAPDPGDAGKRQTLAFTVGAENKAAVANLSRGDVVNLTYREGAAGAAHQLQSVTPEEVSTSPEERILALLLAAGLLGVVFLLLLRGRIRDLALGTDNRYSKSKFQMAVWFGVLLVAYLATVGLRWRHGGLDFVGGIGIPQNLLLLSGLSALSFAAAKAITQGRVDAAVRPPSPAPAGPFVLQPGGAIKPATAAIPAPATAAVESKVMPGVVFSVAATASAETVAKIQGAPEPRFWYDLFRDDQGRPDLGDFQMLIMTGLAVLVWVLTVVHFLGTIELRHQVSLPDIDSTILAAFGLGQGAYLAKKVIGDAGGGRPDPAPGTAKP